MSTRRDPPPPMEEEGRPGGVQFALVGLLVLVGLAFTAFEVLDLSADDFGGGLMLAGLGVISAFLLTGLLRR